MIPLSFLQIYIYFCVHLQLLSGSNFPYWLYKSWRVTRCAIVIMAVCVLKQGGDALKCCGSLLCSFGWNSVQDRSGVFILTQTSIRALLLCPCPRSPCRMHRGEVKVRNALEEGKIVRNNENRGATRFLMPKTPPPQPPTPLHLLPLWKLAVT